MLGRGSVRIIQYGLSPTEALEQYVRWITFSRSGFQGWSFKLPVVMRVAAAWIGVIGAALTVLFGSSLGALLFGISAVSAGFSIGLLHEAVACRDPAAGSSPSRAFRAPNPRGVTSLCAVRSLVRCVTVSPIENVRALHALRCPSQALQKKARGCGSG